MKSKRIDAVGMFRDPWCALDLAGIDGDKVRAIPFVLLRQLMLREYGHELDIDTAVWINA